MNGYLRIPVLSSSGTLDGSHRASPIPIMMIKELEVDRTSYEQWRVSCEVARKHARAAKAKAPLDE